MLTPVLALITWSLIVWVWMYALRLPAITKAELAPDDVDYATVGQDFAYEGKADHVARRLFGESRAVTGRHELGELSIDPGRVRHRTVASCGTVCGAGLPWFSRVRSSGGPGSVITRRRSARISC